MRQFFKFLLASCLGTTIAMFLVFLGIISIGASIAASSKDFGSSFNQTQEHISPNSVLHLKLQEAIPELTDNVEATKFELNPQAVLGLHDIVKTIKHAKTDDKIKGIFLEGEYVAAGYTTIATIRKALEDFKASGKFVYSYAPYYSQGAYYLASASNRIALAPLGIVDWRGFSTVRTFYKDALDKLDIHYEVFYAGRFKSASEPFRRNSMSDESRQQTQEYLDGMYEQMLADVSKSRSITEAKLRQMANEFSGIDPQAALDGGLVDKTIYREAWLAEMREEMGLDKDDDIKFVKLAKYFQAKVPKGSYTDKDKIAVLVAEGVIVDGKGDAAKIGDKQYVEVIEELRQDDNVKAVVLRVNSPGGSAMASDHIWQSLMDLKATGKPLVVSMGSVAASGGYYIACAADSIFAEASTITGSIGVVSAIPQLQNMLDNKLGVHFDSVKTGPYAHGLNPVFNMTEGERRLLQNRTDVMYQTFMNRVSEGRGISVAQVDSIAQGRVWIGTKAKEIGLVDGLGNLETAIQAAADMAEMGGDYVTQTYPKQLSPFERMFEELMNPQEMLQTSMLKHEMGSLYPHYVKMKEMTEYKGLQMRMLESVDFQ